MASAAAQLTLYASPPPPPPPPPPTAPSSPPLPPPRARSPCRCIFAHEDITRLIPRATDCVLLEEPEHLNW